MAAHGVTVCSAETATAIHYHGFDRLRAVFAACVVVLHCGYFGPQGQATAVFATDFMAVLRHGLLLLAVPGFITMSAFLFVRRLRGDGSCDSAGQRYIQILVWYVFWTGLWAVFTRRSPNMALYEWLRFAISGGPSIFFYFFSLLLVSMVAAAACRAPAGWAAAGLAGATVAVAFFPWLAVHAGALHRLTAYWNPLSFVPYACLACVLAAHEPALQRNGRRVAARLGAGYVLLSAVEWLVFTRTGTAPFDGETIPPYARPSLVAGAAAAVSWALARREAVTSIERFVALNSLGIYCTHMFLLDYLTGIGLCDPGARIAIALPGSLAAAAALRCLSRYRLV